MNEMGFRKKFIEESIISFLYERKAGLAVPEIARRNGCAEGKFYIWRFKFGCIEVSDPRNLMELEGDKV